MSPVVLTGGSTPSLGLGFDWAYRLVLTVSIKAMQPNFERVVGMFPPVGAIVGRHLTKASIPVWRAAKSFYLLDSSFA
jgi:hypothetical protein